MTVAESPFDEVEDKSWYTTGEVAKELHYTDGWIWILINRGTIKAERSDTAKKAHYRVSRSELLRLKQQGGGALAPDLSHYKAEPILVPEEVRAQLAPRPTREETEEAMKNDKKAKAEKPNGKESDVKAPATAPKKEPNQESYFTWERIFGRKME